MTFVTDRLGRVQSCQGDVELIFGYEPARIIGRGIDFLLPDIFQTSLEAFVLAFLDQDDGDSGDRGLTVRGRRRDGATIAVNVSVAHARDEHGQELLTGVIREAGIIAAPSTISAPTAATTRLIATPI